MIATGSPGSRPAGPGVKPLVSPACYKMSSKLRILLSGWVLA